MDKTVTVHVIQGRLDGAGIVDLAKFFSRADAESHFGKFERARYYRDVAIVARDESVDAQHPAHAEHVAALLKPKTSAAAPTKPGLVTTKPS